MKPLIYLASPHSHTLSSVREDRYREALRCNTWLVGRGIWVYSPIVASHHVGIALAINGPIGTIDPRASFEYWKEFDTEMIKRCDELWILEIKGTADSVGVQAERLIAMEMKKRVMHIWPKEAAGWSSGSSPYVIIPEDY